MAIKVALQCPWQHTLFYAEPGKPLQLIKTQPCHHSTNASNVLALPPRPPSPLTVSPSESQRVLDLLDKAISKVERKQYAHVKSRLPLLISAAEIPAEEETQHLNWASLNAFVVTENKPNILCSSANGRHLVASFLVRCFTQGIQWCDLHKQYYCQKWVLLLPEATASQVSPDCPVENQEDQKVYHNNNLFLDTAHCGPGMERIKNREVSRTSEQDG